MPEELSLPTPEFKRRITTMEILQGQIIPAIDRVLLMEEDAYEDFILEWVDGYLKTKYQRLRSFASAGDKGRDIVGYYADGNIDIYHVSITIIRSLHRISSLNLANCVITLSPNNIQSPKIIISLLQRAVALHCWI